MDGDEIMSRLDAASNATFTDEARLAVVDGILEISRLRTELSAYRCLYECVWSALTIERTLRKGVEKSGQDVQAEG